LVTPGERATAQRSTAGTEDEQGATKDHQTKFEDKR